MMGPRSQGELEFLSRDFSGAGVGEGVTVMLLELYML